MADIQRIQELYQLLITAKATREELEELYFLADQPENDEIFQGMFASSWNELEQADENVRVLLKKKEERVELKPAFISAFYWIGSRRAVAAAVLLLVGLGGYFYFKGNSTGKQRISEITAAPAPEEVKAPQTTRATITLAGGKKIFLDSAANGTLARLGTVQLKKLANGQIAYSGYSGEISYNTLTNPRGSRPVAMTLSDGSRVWLNAGSSLTYPIAFTGKQRNVEITGEAYFEVAHKAAMPFVIKNNFRKDVSILVLGTALDVNAYDDEAALKVTLLNGAVKVNKGSKSVLLDPGQQAQLNDKAIEMFSKVDTREVLAWKNGKFVFGDAADIGTIMRQISRWYDIDVEYQGNITGHIGGSISRDVNVSQVLKMLETTGVMKFRIEGNSVIVMPSPP